MWPRDKVCPSCGKSEKEYPEGFGVSRRIKLCRVCYDAKREAYKKSLAYKQRRSRYYREWYRKNGRKRASDYGSVILIWANNHPEAIKAGNAVRKAIRDGVLSRPDNCSLCRRQSRVIGHHQNYDKMLDVAWVCASCHRKIHNSLEGDLT